MQMSSAFAQNAVSSRQRKHFDLKEMFVQIFWLNLVGDSIVIPHSQAIKLY